MTSVDVSGVAPTVAVGIGQAGCSMISMLHDLVREEGIEEKFRFVGIDANLSDLRSNLDYESDEATMVELEPPEQWDDHKYEYDFLHDQLLPGGERQLQRSGALRKRRIGRYYVDSHRNFEEVRNHLDGVINQFAKLHDDYIEKKDQKMNIWVMNSLGGGTGSGSFPIIAAMIKEITDSAEWPPGSFTISGVGALPNAGSRTEEYSTYHLNTYAALRDIRVLIGEDDAASDALQLGEERKVKQGDRIDVDSIIFHKYFLQPFNPDEMSSDAYKHQLNKASASIPLYFALIEEQENWPDMDDSIGSARVNERLYVFDTYEMSIPAEDLYRYFTADERIATLESEIDELEREQQKVVADLDYLDAVSEVDIESYIDEYRMEREDDDEEVTVLNIVPEEVDLPDRIATDMVTTAKGAVGGLSLSIPNIDDAVDERYDSEWDSSETSDLDHKDVFRYIFYQLAARRAREEQRDHELHQLIESKWEKYRDELSDEFAWLGAKDAPTKWQDGLQKFYSDKISDAKEEVPTGALYVGGLFGAITVLLIIALLQSVAAIQALAERNIAVSSVTLSWAWALIGITMLGAFAAFGYYFVRRMKVSSLEDEEATCEAAYTEYTHFATVEEKMRERLERLDLGREPLERRQAELEEDISDKETLLANQQSLIEKVEDRLAEFNFEFDRKLALPLRDPEGLKEQNTKAKIRHYIQTHPSIDLEVINQEIYDTDIEFEGTDASSVDGQATGDDAPDSIRWFTERDHIEASDIAQALNDILDDDNRLGRSPLSDYRDPDPDIDEILQYIWNPVNSYIKEAEGGNRSYASLEDDFHVPPHDGKISDEFRVWLMGVYTNFYLQNAAVYVDFDDAYAGDGDGDVAVARELGLPEDRDPNLVTSRFAYPEFYSTHDHPLKEEMESYPK